MRWVGHEFYWGCLENRATWESDVDGRIILKLILKKQDGMDWILLAQIRDRWVTVVNMVIILWAA
jgi:hypothetical protein